MVMCTYASMAGSRSTGGADVYKINNRAISAVSGFSANLIEQTTVTD